MSKKGTDSYLVLFLEKKQDGYWHTVEKIYGGYNSKSAHKKVEKKWKEEYNNKEVKLVSIKYI